MYSVRTGGGNVGDWWKGKKGNIGFRLVVVVVVTRLNFGK